MPGAYQSPPFQRNFQTGVPGFQCTTFQADAFQGICGTPFTPAVQDVRVDGAGLRMRARRRRRVDDQAWADVVAFVEAAVERISKDYVNRNR